MHSVQDNQACRCARDLGSCGFSSPSQYLNSPPERLTQSRHQSPVTSHQSPVICEATTLGVHPDNNTLLIEGNNKVISSIISLTVCANQNNQGIPKLALGTAWHSLAYEFTAAALLAKEKQASSTRLHFTTSSSQGSPPPFSLVAKQPS